MRSLTRALACPAVAALVSCAAESGTATGGGGTVTVSGGSAGATSAGAAGAGGHAGGGAAGAGGKTPPVAGFAGAAQGGAGQSGAGKAGAAGATAGSGGAATAGMAGASGSATAGAAGVATGGAAGAVAGGASGTAGSNGTAAKGGTGGVVPGPACNGAAFPQGVPDPDGFIASAASYQDTDPAVDAAVNAAMAKLTGCSPGSDCPITGLPGSNADEVCQSWFAAVTAELRAQGFCAGQHVVGSTDEIAVGNISCNAKWYGYHVCFYGGPKVVWNPGARRGWWMIASQYCP